MPDGLIGVGVESQGRASLAGSGFVPMWPYFEGNLERLLELTVESAWRSGRSYWMEVAARWAIQMSDWECFERVAVQELLREMASSEALSQAGRARVLGVSAQEGSE